MTDQKQTNDIELIDALLKAFKSGVLTENQVKRLLLAIIKGPTDHH